MAKEKASHTRRYRETDNRLMKVAYRISDPMHKTRITVRELVRRAKVGSSTFYRHFRSLLDFSHRHECALVGATERLLLDLSPKEMPPEAIFFMVNKMFYQNRGSVRLLLVNNDNQAIRQAIWILRPLLTKDWPTYGRESDRKIYCFFVAMTMETIRLWAINYKFRQDYIEVITRQMMFISKNIALVLAPLMKVEEGKGFRVRDEYR